MDAVLLRESVQQCLRSGALPATASARTFAGAGNGAPCALCSRAITRDQTEFELEFRRPRAPFVTFYHLHPRCYAAWELER
jgi:hypothetical protein